MQRIKRFFFVLKSFEPDNLSKQFATENEKRGHQIRVAFNSVLITFSVVANKQMLSIATKTVYGHRNGHCKQL